VLVVLVVVVVVAVVVVMVVVVVVVVVSAANFREKFCQVRCWLLLFLRLGCMVA